MDLHINLMNKIANNLNHSVALPGMSMDYTFRKLNLSQKMGASPNRLHIALWAERSMFSTTLRNTLKIQVRENSGIVAVELPAPDRETTALEAERPGLAKRYLAEKHVPDFQKQNVFATSKSTHGGAQETPSAVEKKLCVMAGPDSREERANLC